MPLVKGKAASSKKGFSENVRREMHEGKPQKQAVAIAYSEARRGKHHGRTHSNSHGHHSSHSRHSSDTALKAKIAR